MDPFVYNAVAASTFIIWDYCITFDDEIELIWRYRQKWNWVTAVFSIIRYVPIISSTLIIVNSIAPFFPISQDSCLAWMIAVATWTKGLMICFEVLLTVRVLALYGQHRLLFYGLITFSICFNITRAILLAKTLPEYKFGENIGSNVYFIRCNFIKFPSIKPSIYFVADFLPEVLFFLLAVIKLIHTKSTRNIAVSQLLVVIVRDGTWAFMLIFAFFIWNLATSDIPDHNTGLAFIWVVPLIGFTGSRLILNLRSTAESQLGGTDVALSEINLAPIDVSNTIPQNS